MTTSSQGDKLIGYHIMCLEMCKKATDKLLKLKNFRNFDEYKIFCKLYCVLFTRNNYSVKVIFKNIIYTY